jgi:hypothetical protein
MRTRPIIALALLVAAPLAAPGVAPAKEIQQVKLCGASACFTFDRPNSGDKLLLFDGVAAPAPAPARPAPWYRLKITVGGPDTERFTYTNAYVPSLGLVRRRAEGGGFEWADVMPDLRPVLRNESSRLKPLPASRLRGLARPAASAGTPAPARGAASTVPSGGGAPWGWIAGAAVAAASALLFARVVRRRQ